MLNSYPDIKFEVIKRVDNRRYGNGDDIRLDNLGPIASFIDCELTTSSGNHLEDIKLTHTVSFMHKLKSSDKYSDELTSGFDRGRNRRQNELTNIKNIKVKYHRRIMPKDIFGFSDHQEEATYGLAY